MFNSELYIPRVAVITGVRELTYDTKLFKVQFKDRHEGDGSGDNDYKPGQFVQVSVLGAGEVPISLCSSLTEEGYFELCVRKIGLVTGAMDNLKEEDELGIRGPYGNGFPMEQLKGQDLLFVAGGIGLAPLRSVIKYVLDNRDNYGQVVILYGARTKEDIVFPEELHQWGKEDNVKVLTTIDRPQKSWDGHVGVVTTLLREVRHPAAYKALVCGPAIMIHFAIKELLDLGLKEEDIITTLERHMKCGVGKCGHCYIGGKYVCTDGPVFTYAQLNALSVPL
ncbi:Anaerobic sulfite reductase subunit B [subsurface metagenome]